MTRLNVAIVWVALHVCFFIGWAASEELRLAPATGRSVLVRVQPVDPRDFLRGQYMRLGYDFSTPEALWAVGEEGDPVWCVLRPEGDFYVFTRAQTARPRRLPAGQVAVRGTKQGWQLRFGVERYFVPEGTETPDWNELTVRLRIGDDGSGSHLG